jgi:hypothetical protein
MQDRISYRTEYTLDGRLEIGTSKYNVPAFIPKYLGL